MKKEIEIRLFDVNRDSVNDLLIFHQELFGEMPFSKYLIYFANNFEDYLRKAIFSSDNSFYLIYLKNALSGFIHFKTFNNYVFLNNFYALKSVRGGGIGKIFLKECLTDFTNIYDFIELDVFESNSNVVKWYSKLGFKILTKKNWYSYRIVPVTTNFNYELKEDPNGFSGVFIGKEKVATIVNGNVFLHNQKGICSFLKSGQELLSNLELESNKDFIVLEKDLLDKSFRMSGKIDTVYKNL